MLASNESGQDPDGLIRVVWYAPVDKNKAMASRVWEEEWDKKSNARKSDLIKNSTIEQVVTPDLMFTSRQVIKKVVLYSFYVALGSHID